MPRRLRIKLLTAICAAGAVSLASAPWAAAATYTVNDSSDFGDFSIGDAICDANLDADPEPECTLRAAIEEANFTAGGSDQVNFDPSFDAVVLTGPLEIAAPLTIQGNGGSGPDSTLVSGDDAWRAFKIASGAATSFRDILIKDAWVGADSGGGAAIRTDAVTTLDRVTVTTSSLADLTEDGRGAGIYNANSSAKLTVTDSAITDNTITTEGDVSSPSGAAGAGVASAGPLSLSNTTVSGNEILDGGGTFAHGGGVWADGDLAVIRSAITDNAVNGAAAEGAGIFASSKTGKRSLVNSTISANAAPDTGAGGAQLGGDAAITNLTFAGNVGGDSGGSDLVLHGADTAITAQNTIFGSADACEANDGAVLTGTNNIDLGTSCGLSGAGNRQSTDPMLGVLALNAPGSTMTHAIALGSPALDAADWGCGGGLVTDQRGFARSQGGPRCDVGAYEAQHRLLRATRTGTGSGSVIAAGIACGGDCSESYVEGTTVLITATPASDSTFSSWSGCDISAANLCTVTLGADRMVSASFALTPVTPPPSGGGTVTLPSPSKKCKKGFKRVAGKCKRVKRKPRT